MEATSREQAPTLPQRKAWTDREGQVTSNRNWRRSCFKKRLRDSDGYVGMGVARAVVKLHKPMVRNRNERFKIMRKVAWAANIQSVKDLLEGAPQKAWWGPCHRVDRRMSGHQPVSLSFSLPEGLL